MTSVVGRLLLGLLGLGLVAGCSSLRLGYDNLPTLIRWQVDRYVDLDDAQEARLDQRLREAHQWHRDHQLPVYTRWIERVRREGAGEVTPAVVAGWRAEALSAWPPLVEQLAPAVAELGVSLKPAQLARLERELASENRDSEREYFGGRTPDKVRANRIKRWEERAEHFFGGVTAPQQQLLAERARREPVTAAESDWWALRMARQRVWVRLMHDLATERPPLDEATRRTQAALLTIFAPTDPGLKARDQASSQATDSFVAGLMQPIAPAQQRQFDERLKGYAEDLVRLAASSSGTAPRRAALPAAPSTASPGTLTPSAGPVAASTRAAGPATAND